MIKYISSFIATGGSELHRPVALPRGGRAGRGHDHKVPPPHAGAGVVRRATTQHHSSVSPGLSALCGRGSPLVH